MTDSIGFSVPYVNEFFNKICRVLVNALEALWGAKVKGFLENLQSPLQTSNVRWILNVYINSLLKTYSSFKQRYSIMNLGLVEFNKRFLYATVELPRNTFDSRLLKESSINVVILNGDVMPDKAIRLGNLVGDSAFYYCR